MAPVAVPCAVPKTYQNQVDALIISEARVYTKWNSEITIVRSKAVIETSAWIPRNMHVTLSYSSLQIFDTIKDNKVIRHHQLNKIQDVHKLAQTPG